MWICMNMNEHLIESILLGYMIMQKCNWATFCRYMVGVRRQRPDFKKIKWYLMWFISFLNALLYAYMWSQGMSMH